MPDSTCESQTAFYAADRKRPPSEDPRELQEELARLRPFAELGRMAATVAHEVRNPLAGISANTELLRESVTAREDRESIDIILGEVDRLGRLVSDLLHYTRESEPRSRPLDLGQLCRRVCELSTRDAEQAGVSIETGGAGYAEGDPELSCQALLNLVRNAIQASPAGATVHLQAVDRSVLVIDQGQGVPESIRSRLFEPFVTGRTRGLGLGAAVARRCLRRQGGDVQLAQSDAEGSRFHVSWR
ncbi:MAG: two-component system sensor histidine kinase NtrB [Planctomycetota bacterium]